MANYTVDECLDKAVKAEAQYIAGDNERKRTANLWFKQAMKADGNKDYSDNILD